MKNTVLKTNEPLQGILDWNFGYFRSYFSEKGIEHSMARIPIASSDFSKSVYTYSDQEDDDNLTHFALTEEDFLYKVS